jgi:hypothetical protein
MIPMTMIGKVRRMFHRQNKSVREIARLTSLSRNTISKYLSMEIQEEPKYQRRSQSTRLTPFHEALVQALSVDARRAKKERRTAWMLFQEIKASGYDGCYSRVTDFIRAGGKAKAKRFRSRRLCRCNSSWARRSSLIGPRKDWLSAAFTASCRCRT